MEIGRGRCTNQKQVKKNKGVALVTVLALSIVVLLALGGIYWIVTNLMSGSQTIKTYTSVKEAAKGGVEEAIIWIKSNQISPDDCTRGRLIKYRISGYSELADGIVYICFIGIASEYELTGVAESLASDSEFISGYMYRIISEVKDPKYNTQYRVEAVFVK